MSSPLPLPAERGPRLGPKTGDFDPSLVILGRVAGRRAAERATEPLEVYSGPRTGELAVLPREMSVAPVPPEAEAAGRVPRWKRSGIQTALAAFRPATGRHR